MISAPSACATQPATAMVMAAGLAANLTLNPFQSVTTVTTQIVGLLTGEQEFDSPKTLSAFGLGLTGSAVNSFVKFASAMYRAYEASDASIVEINPLVLTKNGEFVAADCRITIDDYAVGRHPELGIEIAREFDHPPTALEQVAYAVEQNDHRGTFYFAQLATTAAKDSKGLVGFHGAGGGGSMMSMDAIVNAGFTIANFTDTSGNPSASKVYRASGVEKALIGALTDYTTPYTKGCTPPSSTSWKDPDNNVSFHNKTILLTHNAIISIAANRAGSCVSKGQAAKQSRAAMDNNRGSARRPRSRPPRRLAPAPRWIQPRGARPDRRDR